MSTAQVIRGRLEQSETIAIFGHEYVDGDCIGSMLWLWNILESMEKKVSYFTPYPVWKSLQFVPWREKLQTTYDYGAYDILLFVDFSSYDRIEPFTKNHEDHFDKSTLIIIDHHQWSHPEAADFVLKDIQVSSNCEWIYEHVKSRRPESISQEVATYLYLWLTTDSGNFMYEKDSIRLFKNAWELIQKGADKRWILDNIFYRNSLETIQFGNILTQRATIQGDIMRTYYTDEEIQIHNIDKDQADFGFHTLRTIYGPKIYIRLRKSWTMLKWSVRGSGSIDCATMCEKLFKWWWHYNASWFATESLWDIQIDMTNAVQKIQDYIENEQI